GTVMFSDRQREAGEDRLHKLSETQLVSSQMVRNLAEMDDLEFIALAERGDELAEAFEECIQCFSAELRLTATVGFRSRLLSEKSIIGYFPTKEPKVPHRFAEMQFYEPFKSIYQLPKFRAFEGSRLGRAKSANRLIIISYGGVHGTFGSFVGKYPKFCSFWNHSIAQRFFL